MTTRLLRIGVLSALSALSAIDAFGQFRYALNPDTGKMEIAGYTVFSPISGGTSLPASCTAGQVYVKTDAAAGQKIYLGIGSAPCTWEAQGGSGGGSSTGTSFQLGNGSGGFSTGNLGQNADGSIVPSKSITYNSPTACSLVTATITCDASVSNIWQFTLTGNWTLAVTNQHAGSFWIITTQDGVGGRTLSFPPSFLNASTVNSIAGNTTVQSCSFDGTHYFCVPAASTETAGTFRLPERTAPVSAPGAGNAVCWPDSGDRALHCFEGATTQIYTVVQPIAAATSKWITALSNAGVFAQTQPNFTDLLGNATVAQGGSGLTSLTAYALMAAGITSTGNMQQVSGVGTAGQVLTSNGAGALPTWQAASGGGTLNTVGQGWLAPITDCAYCLAEPTEAAASMIIVQFVPTNSINVKTISVANGVNTVGLSMTAGIYSDSAGACGTLLGQTGTVSGAVAAGTKLEMAFAGTVNLTAGTPYWIAIGGNQTFALFGNGITGTTGSLTALLDQTSRPRSGRVITALAGTTMPASCGTINTGTLHAPLVVLFP